MKTLLCARKVCQPYIALQPTSDTVAVVVGLGNAEDETARLINNGGEDILLYSGYQLAPISFRRIKRAALDQEYGQCEWPALAEKPGQTLNAQALLICFPYSGGPVHM
ncbi:MAG: hypothetical protein ACYDDO_15065 [Acidiferrobacterales bacterium]